MKSSINISKFSNLQACSLSDEASSTGATLIYFPKGAKAQCDSRGGAVTSVDTTILDSGSYSDFIDAVVFAGGSSMGLECHEGVRKAIFENKLKNKTDETSLFDCIPCVTGACIFDYGRRPSKKQNQFFYPDLKMGQDLFLNVKSGSIEFGKIGAGTSAVTNKITGKPFWGGQCAGAGEFQEGNILVLIINNSVGELLPFKPESFPEVYSPKGFEKGNTTLSLVVTDFKLSSSSLKRLSQSFHTNLARFISPFQTHSDGDICFAVSTMEKELPFGSSHKFELNLLSQALNLAEKALINGAKTANQD